MSDTMQRVRTQEQIQAWARSEEGKKVLQQTIASARATAEAFREQIRIDAGLLRLPVTV